MTVTFVFVDEILRCDHSNENSLPVLSHGTFLFSKMLENEIWKSGQNMPLTTFGSERVNSLSGSHFLCRHTMLLGEECCVVTWKRGAL